MYSRILVSIAFIATIGSVSVAAQDTFSIVAVDTITGEVGSAGASCIAIDVRLISDVHPGIGGVHTQAWWRSANQVLARSLMAQGLSPAAIIDSVTAHDEQSDSTIRQYGIVVLAGGGTSAAWTGSRCDNYKGHRLGSTYSIQGNILLGPEILDSMEARFLRTTGTLAERLMAAMQGANVPGADTRCLPYGTTSLSAFIRVARPGDRADSLYLDLHADLFDGSREPIEALQDIYDEWRGQSDVVTASPVAEQVTIAPNPASSNAQVTVDLLRPASLSITLYDELGAVALGPIVRNASAGTVTIDVPTTALPRGAYYCRVDGAGKVRTKRLVIDR